jgi:hypothetical protein
VGWRRGTLDENIVQERWRKGEEEDVEKERAEEERGSRWFPDGNRREERTRKIEIGEKAVALDR